MRILSFAFAAAAVVVAGCSSGADKTGGDTTRSAAASAAAGASDAPRLALAHLAEVKDVLVQRVADLAHLDRRFALLHLVEELFDLPDLTILLRLLRVIAHLPIFRPVNGLIQ